MFPWRVKGVILKLIEWETGLRGAVTEGLGREGKRIFMSVFWCECGSDVYA